jgi:hypothetical protein
MQATTKANKENKPGASDVALSQVEVAVCFAVLNGKHSAEHRARARCVFPS